MRGIFKDYIVNEQDIVWLKKAINLACSKKLKQIFSRGGLEKVDILLFDSKNIYILSKRKYIHLEEILNVNNNIKMYKWKHNQ